jgi:hypothetical protein
MNILYIVLSAILSSVVTLMAPSIVLRYRQLKTRKEQRERNMRAKIRKEVDWYLNELRND